jgi:hypothetical protein
VRERGKGRQARAAHDHSLILFSSAWEVLRINTPHLEVVLLKVSEI